jgi:allantoinase
VTTLVVRSRRVVLPGGQRAASVRIEDGLIAEVSAYDDVPAGAELVDGGDLVLSPGVVDTHVHINEPGRTEWEGFDTGTRAAAAGGITTIIDMPLNSVPATTDRRALEAKRQAAIGNIHIDVGFWGGVIPGNVGDLEALADGGVRGFKCFLTASGVEEFPSVDEDDLRAALPVLAGLPPSARLLLVHAEEPAMLRAPAGEARRYRNYLASRPVEAEVASVEMMASLAREYHVPTHIVHVSSSEGLSAVARARSAGAPLTAETCPHYLTFTADEISDGATAYKCAPPIREPRHRDALWEGLRQGACNMVASDHSPAPASLKAVESGDFATAWGGIASLELALAAVWTGASTRGFGQTDICNWMSGEPAILAGLAHRKGAIRPGFDADLVLWNSEREFIVRSEALQQRNKLTPYDGRTLRGVVHSTYLRGVRVWHNGRLDHAARGRLL